MDFGTETASDKCDMALSDDNRSPTTNSSIKDDNSTPAKESPLHDLTSPSTIKLDDSGTQGHASTKYATAAGSTSTTRYFPWERCPYEIRDAIFKAVSDDYSGGWGRRARHYFEQTGYRLSPLVVALRRLPISYEHVLQWVSKETNVRLYFPNGVTGLTRSELRIFSKMTMWF